MTPGGEVISSKRFGDVQDGNAWYYFNYDMRGSTTVILKPDGGYKKDYYYDTFGNTTEGGGSFYNETQFTGATYDKSTGMHYMNARYYNPSTGRFLTQDSYTGNPYDPWTQNLYAYCGNNPVNFVDPTGHIFNFIAAGIGALVGGAVGFVTNGIANLVEGKDFTHNWEAATIGGFVSGTAAGLTCGASLIASAVISSAAGSIAEEVVYYVKEDKELTWKEIGNSIQKVAVDTAFGTAFAVAGGNFAKKVVEPAAETGYRMGNKMAQKLFEKKFVFTSVLAGNSSYSIIKSIFTRGLKTAYSNTNIDYQKRYKELAQHYGGIK